MNLIFNIIVIVGGLATNSMAILADCIHDMSDTISIALAWALERVAQKNSTDKYSYGYQRFSILGAVIISVFVIVMAFIILKEAIPRLFVPEGVDAGGMMFWDGASYLDPFVSIGIALWLIFNLGRNLYKSVEVLLQKTPDNFDVDEFKELILAVDGVNDIEDFHVWSLDGIDSVMTLKVGVDFGRDISEIKKEIYNISNRYHVVDITIEID